MFVVEHTHTHTHTHAQKIGFSGKKGSSDRRLAEKKAGSGSFPAVGRQKDGGWGRQYPGPSDSVKGVLWSPVSGFQKM